MLRGNVERCLQNVLVAAEAERLGVTRIVVSRSNSAVQLFGLVNVGSPRYPPHSVPVLAASFTTQCGARHVARHIVNPRLFSHISAYDVASLLSRLYLQEQLSRAAEEGRGESNMRLFLSAEGSW
jgi:hypothetical protein